MQEGTILWLLTDAPYINILGTNMFVQRQGSSNEAIFLFCLALLFCQTALRGRWCSGHTLEKQLGAKQIWKSIYFRVQYSKYLKMDRKVNSNVDFCMMAHRFVPWSVERETEKIHRSIVTTIKREILVQLIIASQHFNVYLRVNQRHWWIGLILNLGFILQIKSIWILWHCF